MACRTVVWPSCRLDADDRGQLLDRGGRFQKRCSLGIGELDFDDLLRATLPELHRHAEELIAHDLVVVVLPQATGALMITISPSALRGKRAGVLGDLPEIWKELHRQATGVDLRDGDFQSTVRAREGRVVAEYTYDPPPPEFRASSLEDSDPPPDRTRGLAFDLGRKPQWRLVYREVGRCRIAAVDRAEPGDPPRLTSLLDELRISPELISR